MLRIILALLLLASPAFAQQPPVLQSGTVTPGHAVQWTADGVVQDAGTAAQGTLTSLGITAQGPSFCQNSDLVTNPFNELCFGVNTSSAATISLAAFGGATPQQLCFNINGSVICLPNGFAGTIAISGTAPIVVNPTTGNISCLNFTSTVSGCVPASGGGTSNFLRADGTFSVPSGSGIGTVTSATIAAGTGISVSGTCTITSTGTCTVANTGVTSVASGTGLTGGPVTTTGTLSLAAIPADDILLNATGGSAAPTGQAVGNCATALTYSTSGHAFGCNSSVGSGTVTSVATGTGLTGGTITSTGTISLATIANNTVLGNVSGITAAPIALTATQLTTLCNAFSSTLSGCVPLSGGGTINFLRADGTFAAPPGGGGTVTSISTGCGSSASSTPITTTGTIFATEPTNAQTGTTYTVVDGDCGKLTTFSNGSAVAVTLGQAGTGGFFAAGWFADYHNKGAGIVTITPTTSTIDGAATLVLLTGQGATIVSDGTNYQIIETPPVIGPASATSGHIATFSGTSGKLIQDGGAVPTGTVTSVTCNGGLTGGTITTTGTCAVDIATNTNIWSGTANKPIDAAGNRSSLGVVAVAISTATFTPNFQQGINFSITLSSGCPCTLDNPSNAYNGLSGFIEVIQDGTGSRTITTYGSTWKFSGGVKPVLSTAASAKDVLPFFCDSSIFCMVGAIQTAFQ